MTSSSIRSLAAKAIFGLALTSALTITLILAPSAFAQQAKVLKVSGRKAIVQFPDDARPKAGQMIDLGVGGVSSMSSDSGVHKTTGARSQMFGGSGEFSNLTNSSSSVSTSTFQLEGRYGINQGEMEFGGLLAFLYRSSTGTSSRSIGPGGFFDYNLVPNRPGTELVYGGGALAQYFAVSTTTGSAEASSSTLRFELGGQLKWYPLGDQLAVRGDLVYRYDQNSGTTSYTTTGFVVKGGLYFYF